MLRNIILIFATAFPAHSIAGEALSLNNPSGAAQSFQAANAWPISTDTHAHDAFQSPWGHPQAPTTRAEDWTPGFGPSPFNGVATSFSFGEEGAIYVGGTFTVAGNILATGIARWDGGEWSTLGEGVNGPVHALVRTPDGHLYVGGNFSQAGGKDADNIAMWDGNEWHPVGSGFSSWVLSLEYQDGLLYAGGFFPSAGDVIVNRVAVWDGTAWAPLGEGVNNVVRAIVGDGNGGLYVGGQFTSSSGQPSTKIAHWSGSEWEEIHFPGGDVHALAMDASGDLYAGGSFFGHSYPNNIGRWDGTAWHDLGDGLMDDVYAIAVAPNGDVYAGGKFERIGQLPVPGPFASRIARWDGSQWHTLEDGVNDVVHSLALSPEGVLHVGGEFKGAGGNLASFAAAWDGNQWQRLGPDQFGGASETVFVYTEDDQGNIYVGGRFELGGTGTVNHVMKWDGATWSPLGTGMDGTVLALAMGPDGLLYAGGLFEYSGDIETNRIAVWNGSEWSAMGAGIDADMTHPGAVGAILVDSDDVYVAGVFSKAGDVQVSNIALWTGQEWEGLGSSSLGSILALAMDAQGSLYAAGTGSGAGNIRRWDGDAWNPLSSGISGQRVRALTIGPDDALYAGGYFHMAGGGTARNVARWDGSWSAVGSHLTGHNAEVFTLTTAPDGTIYAGGYFTNSGGVPLRNLAAWNGDSWESVGEGTNGPIRGMTANDQSLWVGGEFSVAGSTPSYRIGHWNREGSVSTSQDGLPAAASFLEAPYPNPAISRTSIPFRLSEDTHVNVAVFDMLGRQVAVLIDEGLPAGEHRVEWDASDVAAGVYVVRAEFGSSSSVRRIVVLR